MNEELTFDAVVLANGDYPSTPLPLRILADASFVACCDGAGNTYIQNGRVPDVIIGDGDSFSEENRRLYGHLLHRNPDQETNDLTKTVNYLAQLGKRRIAILGATGKREDHTLGNISLLLEYMRQGLHVRMYTDHGVFVPCNGEVTFPCHTGQQISLFNFGAKGIHADGLRYPLRDFTSWWQGTLNECVASSFTIHADGEYLLFLNHVDG